MRVWMTVGALLIVGGCAKEAATPGGGATPSGPAAAGSFQADVDFLKKHTPVVVLTSPDGRARAAVAPAYQGRVMTSTAAGPGGASFGWINRELIASGKTG